MLHSMAEPAGRFVRGVTRLQMAKAILRFRLTTRFPSSFGQRLVVTAGGGEELALVASKTSRLLRAAA